MRRRPKPLSPWQQGHLCLYENRLAWKPPSPAAQAAMECPGSPSRSDQAQHLTQNFRIDSTFHPDPGLPDCNLNGPRRLIPAQWQRDRLRDNSSALGLTLNAQWHKTRPHLRRQLGHRLAAPRPKQSPADLKAARHIRHRRSRRHACGENFSLLLGRPIPPPPLAGDHLNPTVISVLMTVLMHSIRTVIIHDITSPKSRRQSSAIPKRAAR